jgi:uncharacterized protein (TIGR02594 family)
MEQMEPRWLIEARKCIGLHEAKAPENNPEIVQFWHDIKRSGIKDDKTPWCAAFAGAMLERAGITSTRFESAKSYLDWGEALNTYAYGCVVIFNCDGGGHVGFVVGQQANGDLLVLGGNQSDAVNIKAFPTSRVSGYRWPKGEPKDTRSLPVGNAALSTSEA